MIRINTDPRGRREIIRDLSKAKVQDLRQHLAAAVAAAAGDPSAALRHPISGVHQIAVFYPAGPMRGW